MCWRKSVLTLVLLVIVIVSKDNVIYSVERSFKSEETGEFTDDYEYDGIRIVTAKKGIRPIPDEITWSHDEKFLAASGGNDINIINMESGKPVDVIKDIPGITIGNVQWSPNGEEFHYESFAQGGNNTIFIYNLSQQRSRVLTSGSTVSESSCWSPDNKRIVYKADNMLKIIDIAKGTDMPVDPGKVGYGVWTAKGDICYLESDCSEPENYSVKVYSPGKDSIKQTPKFTPDGGARMPLFSPNGAKLAWVSKRYKPTTLWVMDVGSLRKEIVYRSINYIGRVHWSPDSKQIAFIVTQEEVTFQILLVASLEDGTVRRITPEGRSIYAAAWSSDSKKIAFISYRISEEEPSGLVPVDVDLSIAILNN